jgi:lariat debranching enzyme
LYYGGWVAPNIYYLGASGVLNFKKGTQSLRIAGISGIDKPYHYQRGYFESYPYKENDYRSLYHMRQFEV